MTPRDGGWRRWQWACVCNRAHTAVRSAAPLQSCSASGGGGRRAVNCRWREGVVQVSPEGVGGCPTNRRERERVGFLFLLVANLRLRGAGGGWRGQQSDEAAQRRAAVCAPSSRRGSSSSGSCAPWSACGTSARGLPGQPVGRRQGEARQGERQMARAGCISRLPPAPQPPLPPSRPVRVAVRTRTCMYLGSSFLAASRLS